MGTAAYLAANGGRHIRLQQ